MNITQIKCLSVFSVFAIIGFGPISPGCLIGMYLVMQRPAWFWKMINNLYTIQYPPLPVIEITEKQTKQVRKQCFLSLLGLFIIDIAPVPVTPVIAFFIIIIRPKWFYQMVAVIYSGVQQKDTINS